ncbi:hypothetical protein ABZ345_23400 [Lentzea sp. NPDC005914]|uniref:hypothetical protein n=1 Tax=Lentzea sp. NPDC005914 TaxID=3154572 RepID=UPI0033D4CCCD
MRDLLDDDLSELYAVRPADDVRLARLRAQLFTETPKRRAPRWVGIAAAAVAVVMITGLVVVLRPVRHEQDAPATMPTAPATSLGEAATLLELAENPPAKYRHIRYMVWQALSIGMPDSEEWAAAQVEYQIDVWLPTAKGGLISTSSKPTGGFRPIAGSKSWLNSVASPAYGPVLWGTFCATTPCKEISLALPLTDIPKRKLENASSRLLSPYTTNEEKAATYRELAASPEIHWDNGKVSTDGGRTSFTIDPATGQVTGSVELKPEGSLLPDGTTYLEVTVTYEWTDQRLS